MITLKVILIAIALVSTAILALSIRIVLVKDGKFPETHISRNPEMKKEGIHCVKTMDRMEQAKINLQNRSKNVTVLN
jgi:hypothetical protein